MQVDLKGRIGQIRTVHFEPPDCRFGPSSCGYYVTDQDLGGRIDYNFSGDDEITIRIPHEPTEVKFCFRCNLYFFYVIVYAAPDQAESTRELVRAELAQIMDQGPQFTLPKPPGACNASSLSVPIPSNTSDQSIISLENNETVATGSTPSPDKNPLPREEMGKLSPVLAGIAIIVIFFLCFLVVLSLGGLILFLGGYCAGCCTGCFCGIAARSF